MKKKIKIKIEKKDLVEVAAGKYGNETIYQDGSMKAALEKALKVKLL